MRALIIAAGIEPQGYAGKLVQGSWDLIVCADGGAEHALRLAVTPDLIVGDFDSLSPEILDAYEKSGVKCIRLPVEKNFTDLEFAIEQALHLGANSITISGADGGEFDHELANYFLMAKYAEQGSDIRIITSEFEAFLICRETALTGQIGDKFSLLAFSSFAEALTIRGAKYETEDLLLPFGSSRALRNEFSQKRVDISVSSGELLCLKYWPNDERTDCQGVEKSNPQGIEKPASR